MYGTSNQFPKTAASVEEWMDAIGLGNHKAAFRGYELIQLRTISNTDLKQLIPFDGPRKRWVLALKELELAGGASSSATSVEIQPKYNSTSSMYIDSTITQPCIDEIIFCVAIVIHDRIEEGERSKNENPDANTFAMFDVENKPLFRHSADLDASSEDAIFHTIKSIYSIAEFSPECLVISLLYIERLRSLTKILLLLSNWQPILLAAMVVAQKVWDDKSLLNVDFSVICSAYTLKDINSLERRFLELLEYNVSITASMYASYYFELRTLCEKSERSLTLKPLTDEGVRRLEARSEETKSDFMNERRWQSMGKPGDSSSMRPG